MPESILNKRRAIATDALKRTTINDMLSAAAMLTAAGYGLDSVSNQGGGSFYGQKGGLIIDAASVLQFNGEWGFALCFGSPAGLPGVSGIWYPDFIPVMNIAKSVNWGNTDLFPQFGMSSL